MSNIQVGAVYQKIMDEVMDQSHVAFEEDGVDMSAFEELRKTWQKNLSARQCATMPWDPPPPSIMTNPATVPSNTTRSQPQAHPNSTVTQPTIPTNSLPAGVQIKSEPGPSYDLQNLPTTNGLPANYGNSAALHRAGQNLQAKFGDSASLQVNQLQARAAAAAQGAQGLPRSQTQQPPVSQTEEQRRQFDERRRLYAQQQQRQAQQQYQNIQNLQQAQQRSTPVNNTQTDGATDWGNMVAERRAESQRTGFTPYDNDMTIRQQVVEMSREMEGGGLMLPLSEHSKRPLSKKPRSSRAPPNAIAQLDGLDDSDDDDDKSGIKDEDLDVDDEDAINSDLDDPDDNVIDETEEEGNQGEVMLCTYDKVQRVKNKWKCTLKDGVLTTGGKEYVFHKATGEFEW